MIATRDAAPMKEPDEVGERGITPAKILLYIAGALVLLSVVRVITGADDLSSSGAFRAAIALAVPIGLAGMGGLYSERVGVVNIGLEGMMILGTWFGAWGGWHYGVWWGVVLGVLGGGVGGLIHAVACVQFGVNHIVSGVAINLLAGGATRYLSAIAFEGQSGGGITLSPPVKGDLGEMTLPIVAGGGLFGWDSPDAFGWLEKKRWFLLSDTAGLLKGMTSGVSWLTVIALLLVPITFFLLWKTAVGLRLRSAGEYPQAAETLGVNVYRMKYIGTTISGMMAGLGGVFLVVEAGRIYREGQTAGRGFIGLATLIFGNWRPGGVAMGAGLFGYADALQLRAESSVHAMLLFVAIAVALVGLRTGYQKKWGATTILGAVALGFFLWYTSTDEVPSQLVYFTPHLTTLLVLAFAARRLRMPAADGEEYRRGQVK